MSFIAAPLVALAHVDRKVMDFTIALDRTEESNKKLDAEINKCYCVNGIVNRGDLPTVELTRIIGNRIANIEKHLSNLKTAEERINTYKTTLISKIDFRAEPALAKIAALRLSYGILLADQKFTLINL